MGKILRIQKFTTFMEGIILVAVLAVVLGGVYWFAPGLRVTGAKQLKSLTMNSDDINNVSTTSQLSLPTEIVSTKAVNQGLVRIAEYAWNANAGMIVSNGGPRTTKGSLMEAAGINLEIVRQDQVGELRNMQIKFVEEYSKGTEFPVSEKSCFAVSIMGDGAVFYQSTTQEALDAKFGKGKFHVQNIGAIGLSFGEDKVIGPKIWKENPKSMLGCVISSVVGDGDFIVAINYAFANNLKVNTDVTTYDAEAVNFVPSKDDDFINSVKELIQSQNAGYTVPLKEVVNGKLTGKTINHKIDGATTWTPGDKMAFDALTGFTDVISTKDFNNQMAASIIVVKEWALAHEKIVNQILKQSYVAGNQIKQYDDWAVKASEDVAATYKLGIANEPKYWYDLFKGQKGTKDGLDYNIGGSKVFNYADAMTYFGLGSDGVNRYKAVYNQVSTYLTELNPCDFNSVCKTGVVPYEDAVNLYFLKSINDIDAGKAEKIDYTANKTAVLADANWNINFNTGSIQIGDKNKDLETIYNLLIQAENTKLKIIGFTDNVGNPASNLELSKGRAESVKTYLTNKGVSKDRFQLIDGKGQDEPVASNKTAEGKAKNRRVEIALLK
jgi:OOP family OmpA-OmpF porin